MQKEVHSGARFDVYRAVTDKIVAAIEAGAGEFVMPWHRVSPAVGRPANAKSRARYQGVNVVALWAAAMLNGYRSGWWATFEQWKALGARVRKGEHGATIVFYKQLEPAETDGTEEPETRRLVARAFRVFNQDQIDEWEPIETSGPNLVESLEAAETLVARSGAKIQHGGDMAYYDRKADQIVMPEPRRFRGSPTSTPTETYYSTLLHELTHWSGAEHRLDRRFGERFGDEAYAMEELVAELGAAFLCADLEITNEPRPDHAAYLNGWLKVLAADRKAIFTAAQRAREAATHLSNLAAG